MENLKASIYANDSLGKEFMKKIGFNMSQMLISCYYDNKNCDVSDLKEFTSYDRGNCLRFNYGINETKLKTTSQTGQYYGLRLELFSGFDGKENTFLD